MRWLDSGRLLPVVLGGPTTIDGAVSLFVFRPDGSPRNLWADRIAALEPHGEGVRVEIAEAPDPMSSILAEITPSAVADLELVPGSEVWAAVKASDIEV